ncbi:MAG: EFR1 family ferrodoxin [Clostridium sp.]|uniref:EFR1 family ferrodoxin n=1 Tax=Clostridium sp. DSM 8431 TaxID=1761781 RepID=UPI0008F13911|nr:EFR1 family ferrodoxin [Clostridium sp. DSM 8431]MCR4943732.1 EFR1 family ferrodoxin [Clostridium sp.]SFU71433.1 4Fe-4S binding domain-containing protein [Clostridium sp. DSM 8431]
MIGIYFSGTDNTKYCVDKFVKLVNKDSVSIPLESEDSQKYISNEDDVIVFGYPIQFSNCPIFVRDYIKRNAKIFKGKNVFILATMGLFSGDGAGCSARLLKKCGANVVGGLHLRMPDNVCDVGTLKKSREDNLAIVHKANLKIEKSVSSYLSGNPTQDGLSIFNHIAGLFGQRLWYYRKTKSYTDKLKINDDMCAKCGKCVSICPTNNLSIDNQKVVTKNECTMCYRCISECPKQAITLLGNKVVQQYNYNKL